MDWTSSFAEEEEVELEGKGRLDGPLEAMTTNARLYGDYTS